MSANWRSFFAEADIAGIDAVLGQRLGAAGIVGEQLVAVVVEVADQRHVDAQPIEAARWMLRHGGRGSRRGRR